MRPQPNGDGDSFRPPRRCARLRPVSGSDVDTRSAAAPHNLADLVRASANRGPDAIALVRDGVDTGHSKRAGEFISLDELLEEIGADAARWYARSLQVPGLEEEISLALTYDLATAYEKGGNLKAAQEKFAEVYSLNIDYRDVSDKIQSLSRSKPA